MGLFSNLFGNDGKDIDNALNKMKNLAEDIMNAAHREYLISGSTMIMRAGGIQSLM